MYGKENEHIIKREWSERKRERKVILFSIDDLHLLPAMSSLKKFMIKLNSKIYIREKKAKIQFKFILSNNKRLNDHGERERAKCWLKYTYHLTDTIKSKMLTKSSNIL